MIFSSFSRSRYSSSVAFPNDNSNNNNNNNNKINDSNNKNNNIYKNNINPNLHREGRKAVALISIVEDLGEIQAIVMKL